MLKIQFPNKSSNFFILICDIVINASNSSTNNNNSKINTFISKAKDMTFSNLSRTLNNDGKLIMDRRICKIITITISPPKIERNVFLTISATIPVREFVSLIHVFDASHGHHHTENLGTATAIEVMESVVRHGDLAFWLLTTKDNGAMWFE